MSAVTTTTDAATLILAQATPAPAAPPAGTEAPTVGQAIDTLKDAAGQAAKDLGAAAERAANQAAQDLAPQLERAEQAVRQFGRDLDAAANTVALGCSDYFGAAWNALAEWNFGLFFQHLGGAAGTCTESITTSFMGLFGLG